MLFSKEDCLKILDLKLKMKEFNLETWNFKKLDNTLGYLADHYILVMNVSARENKYTNVVEVFVKVLPSQSSHAEFVEKTGVFVKEIDFYLNFIPNVRNIAGCDLSSICDCYFGRDTVIVLEYMKDFKAFDARKTMDFEHCRLVLQAVANLHAACILYEKSRGPDYKISDDYPLMVKEAFCVHDAANPGRDNIITGIRAMTQLIENIPQYAGKGNGQFLHENIDAIYGFLVNNLSSSKKYRNVLCHSDLWGSNILFHYSASGSPDDVRLVDFQLIRYTPPALDVLSFLFLCTDRHVRTVHQDSLLKLYHDELQRLLPQEDVIPWNVFQEQCEELRSAAILNSCHIVQFVSVRQDAMSAAVGSSSDGYKQVVQQDRSQILCEQFHADPVYRHRVTDIITEFVDEHLQNIPIGS